MPSQKALLQDGHADVIPLVEAAGGFLEVGAVLAIIYKVCQACELQVSHLQRSRSCIWQSSRAIALC